MDHRAGKSTREMARKRRDITNIILFCALILAIVLAIAIQKWRSLGLSGGTVFGLLLLLRVLPDLMDKPVRQRIKEERRAERGAVAEEIVGEILEDLDDNFYVIHDIPSPYGNIDHAVIAPHGVFLLETKSHRGRVEILLDGLLINGKPPEKDFIAQTLKNTCWLREEIENLTGEKIWIKPIIVFTHAFVEPGKPIKGVIITNKKFLPEILHRSGRQDPKLLKVWEMREQIGQSL